MSDISKKFTTQLQRNLILGNDFPPTRLTQKTNFILGGMGGSHLGAGLLKVIQPGINIYVHRSYDLPPFSDDFLKDSFCIVSSYSGNTEETISFYQKAKEKGLDVGIITSGGKLLDLAQKNGDLYVLLPEGIQPRDSLGYFMKALMLFVNNKSLSESLESVIGDLQSSEPKENVNQIIKKLSGKIPLVYSSLINLPLAYIWKIKFNETSKTPAFYNVFPELNHNEMEGFDDNPSITDITSAFSCLFLRDSNDHPRIIKRMDVLDELLKSKGVNVENIALDSRSPWHKISHAVELGDLLARSLAEEYRVEPDEVKLIEEFKKKIS